MSRLTILAAISLLLSSVNAQEAPLWLAGDSPEFKEAVTAVLHQQLAGWQVKDRRLQHEFLQAGKDGTRFYIEAKSHQVTFEQATSPTGNFELRVQGRFASDRNTNIQIVPAIKDASNREEQHPLFTLGCRAPYGQLSYTWYYHEPDSRGRHTRSASLHTNGFGERKLSWPEDFRQIIEHESSAIPDLREIWYTIRYVVAGGKLSVFVNDSFIGGADLAGLDLSGSLQVIATAGAQVASIEVLPAPAPSLFVPLPLALHLNASTIDGQRLAPDALPEPGLRAVLNDVDFVFPVPDAAGNDHVDIGRSWFHEGALSGHQSGRGTGIGGRWRGTAYFTPGRIQLRIPPGRYRALHLIAAADHEADSAPVISAQFYRPAAGFPETFSTRVPLFSSPASEVRPVPVKLADGTAAQLYHVTIPMDPGRFLPFDDLDSYEIELTKEVKLFRCYPDPSYYSFHGAGLPSSVHVFAATLEQPPLQMKVTPAQYGHVFTDPEPVAYEIEVAGAAPAAAHLEMVATSYDGTDVVRASSELEVGAEQPAKWATVLDLPRYGFYGLVVTLTSGDLVWTEKLAIARLRPDDRIRGDWAPGKGPFFGYWAWRGGHVTPGAAQEALIMGKAGADGRTGTYEDADEAEKAIARRFKMTTLKHFSGGDHYVTAELASGLAKGLKTKTKSPYVTADMSPDEAVIAHFIGRLTAIETQPSDITQRRYVSFYPEPHLGPYTSGNFAEYWGDSPWELGETELARFHMYEKGLLIGAPIVKEHWPEAQIMLPHGDPAFTVYFMRYSEASRDLIDGIAVDIPVFERMPEQQLHQVAIHRLYPVMQELEKYGKRDSMLFPMYEGPCLPDRPGALTYEQAADNLVRCCLILIGYGVDQITGGFGAFNCAGYWGEQHYGGGVFERQPLEYPKPMYVAYATTTRHLNRTNFVKPIPTGSLSVYAQQFKHTVTGELIHTLWTIRGKRVITIANGDGVTIYDQMDNLLPTEADEDGGKTFTIDGSPVFIRGLTSDLVITLGAVDHADAKPAELQQPIADLADGSWQLSSEPDLDYADNHFYQVRRTPGRMHTEIVTADTGALTRALALTLDPEQEVPRFLMPYYTTLVPPQPITISGKAAKLGLWVRGTSDWGRVVYALRDAKGERWLSVGTREQWNCDDIHSWSFFNFDGWRYITFELPSHSPYDLYRDHGTTWWGAHDGDDIVDLPLRLEKIIVERRTHAIHVNSPLPTSAEPVLFGTLHAEYANAAEMDAERVYALDKLRLPVPAGMPEIDNPIAELATAGTTEPTVIEKITLPDQQADGTRCFVHFAEVEGADSYDIYAGPYADGRGALKVAANCTGSGQLIRRLRPEMDIWLWVVHNREEGRKVIGSKPSAPLKIRLQDLFSNK